MSRPAWQTEELAEEWVDQDELSSARWQDSVSSHAFSSSDISLTEALPSVIRGGSSSPTSAPIGTFVVKEDVPALPFLPKTPGRKSKSQIKNFFSPMPLEMMFEPPSPPPVNDAPLPPLFYQSSAPAVPSRLSNVYTSSDTSVELEGDDEIVETDIPNMVGFDGRKPSINCQFTFSVPEPGSGPHMTHSTPSHPAPPAAPQTDPRLRLFQFQYDTFTRDHLSAMVDSIAVNTPSGGSRTSNISANILSRVAEADGEGSTRLRSTKRIKLSPASDFSDEEIFHAAGPRRPKSRDYVGEAQNLMEQIRQARDFSTISTVASAKLRAEDDPKDENTVCAPKTQVCLDASPSVTSSSTFPSSSKNSKRSNYSSLGYRQKAADLMAQIKQDMKGSRRIVSADTDVSHMASAESEPPLSNKENEPHQAKLKRRITSASDDELAVEVSNMSIEVWQTQIQVVNVKQRASHVVVIPPTPAPAIQTHQDFLVPHNGPAYPSSSVRLGANEDLNRFVSSSTTAGTTLTAGSAESFVKHAGPKQITRIGPDDVAGALSDRVGRMVLDRETMRWVRDTEVAAIGADKGMVNAEQDADAESEDPFRDIESLRDDDSASQREPDGQSRIEIVLDEAEAEDAEEAALNSFSFDDSSAAVVPIMTGVEHDMEDSDYQNAVAIDTTDSDDSGDEELDTAEHLQQGSPYFTLDQFPAPPSHISFGTPLPVRAPVAPAGSTPFPSVRSTMKSNSLTPVSAMKDPNRNKTPAPSGHRRSVSFSDGKREGPIRGLTRSTKEDGDHATDSDHSKSGTGNFFSARSKRIADMLDGLEDQTSDDPSPTKTSSTAGRRSYDGLQPRQPTTSADISLNDGELSRRIFSRSYSHRPPGSVVNTSANATFLTECSFRVTHDRLVQVVTDVQPFEPYWEELSSIDISKKNLESVARLKEFLPKLDSLCLNDNRISWLSGVPGTVRTLSVASNVLTEVTSFNHLVNLEHLDISYNEIESLQQLDCLRHLRELRADGNKIGNISGLQKMDGLVKLSLQSNKLRNVDITGFRWTRLEMLNLSQNGLDKIRGLETLPGLIALNLDHNSLTDLGLEDKTKPCISKLRVLRASGNKLQRLNGAHYPNLRTLYADNNALSCISHCGQLRRLENLSLRNQAKGKLNLSFREVRDIKRLYLSGNPMTSKFITEPCYNLVYFELAACRLAKLPEDFAQLVPNVRVLNLNYNFLEDVKPLEGLSRLKKLTIIGSRVKGTKGLIRMAQGMPEVEMVDFRMNPCTLGWYLPLLVRDVPGALQPSEDPGTKKTGVNRTNGGGTEGKKREDRGGMGGRESWQELDSKFRRDLPDDAYVGRLAYRGLIMRACREIKMLDGVEVSDKERDKATKLLTGILGKRRVIVAR